MPAGIGGLLTDALGGDLNSQMARALAGQQPNPQVPPGGPSSPSGAQGGASPAPGSGQPSAATPAPGQTPAQTYAPDPQNASTIDLLLKVHQQDLAASGINRGLAQMAASFGTAGQQSSKMAALDEMAGPQDDRLAALKQIQGIQEEQFKQGQQQQFAAGAAGMASMLNVSPDQARWLASNPTAMNEVLSTHFRNMSPTEQQKNADAAASAYAQSKGYDPDSSKWTPQQQQDVAGYRANLIAGATGGSDLEQRQYLQEKQSGVTTDDFATWKAKHAAVATTMQTQAKDAQDFKDTAQQDYTSVHSRLTDIQQYVDTLNRDPAAAKQALTTFLPTTGKFGALMPGSVVPQNVKDAAIALQKVQASLSSEQLSNVKNVRNQREFATLGQAATAGLNASASDSDFQTALANLKNRYLDTQATAELTVGHKLTGDLVGHGNSDLLSPTLPSGLPNPYYNGGSEDGKPLAGPELDQVTQAIAAHPEKKQQILDTVRKNGYSPRGLL